MIKSKKKCAIKSKIKPMRMKKLKKEKHQIIIIKRNMRRNKFLKKIKSKKEKT